MWGAAVYAVLVYSIVVWYQLKVSRYREDRDIPASQLVGLDEFPGHFDPPGHLRGAGDAEGQ